MRVLFVSKPIVPPWNDGSKNLVRDIALNLSRARATVMVRPGSPPLGERVDEDPVYGEAGTFAPTLAANSRVLARLLFGEPLDLWHFVFAPNLASSSAARLAKARPRAPRVVQTIASVPRSFRGVSRLLFGDVVVAQSEHTRGRLLAAGVSGVRVIPPCVARPRAGDLARARALVGPGPVVLYPGDLEFSSGARTVIDAAPTILRRVPEARIVLACRRKTPRASSALAELEERARPLGDHVLFLGDVDDMPSLLAVTDVLGMPCDDLYGKVDVPLVVLEALSLGKPLVLARGGPLESVETAAFVEARDPAAFADAIVRALASDASAGQRLYEERFSPSVVASAYDDLYEDMLNRGLP